MARLFGTNGIRGLANKDMDGAFAMRLGQAFGTTLPEGSAVALGTDTRTSNRMLASAVTAGLLSTGVSVRDAGIVTTPALQYAVKRAAELVAGVVVTASHNPPEFNGVKFVDHDGTELATEKEDRVEAVFFASSFRAAPWDRIHGVDPLPGVNTRYVDAVVTQVDAARIRDRHLTVVCDTSNGAGGLTAPVLLRRLGCRTIMLNAQLDGTFPGHASEPTPENVKDLVASVPTFGADLGVVQDGDADRCVFVDERGRYIPGDRTLALVAGQVVSATGGGTVVTPVSSSSCVEDYVTQKGGRVEYTKVGAPVVARRMMEIGAVFGGEENGGLIFPQHQHCRDASMTLAAVLEILARTGRKLGDLIDEVPEYHVHKHKIACAEEAKARVLEAFAAAHTGDRVDRTDGVKVLSKDGWVLVRPSGTEPIVRVYAESRDATRARALGDAALDELRRLVPR
ncbi:MAG TPA: phosphoglucosamine mutase [Candidatus Thermoplasmatota archaeon]|nr:phosphoglucosamine mutase [Candidatus Thermoplasmatota archaeon]